MNLYKISSLNILLLIFIIVFFEYTPVDLWLQSYFYQPETGQWLVDRQQPLLKWLFYDGIKQLFIAANLGLLGVLIFMRHRPWVQCRRQALWTIFLSCLIVPLTISTLKIITQVPCPKHLQRFGGTYPYIRLLTPYPEGFNPRLKRTECYPAGHASGGFALFALATLAKRRRHQIFLLLLAFGIGWIIGGYKMLIGDHFLSHTLVSMVLSGLLVTWIHAAVIRWIPAHHANNKF